jgi:signal transduction histidine kinase
MREANEQLVLAALSARELQVAAEQAQRRQAAFVAAAADELRNPMAPIRIASGMLGRQQAEQPMLGRVQSIVEQQLARMSRLLGHVIAASGSNGTPALHIELKAVDPVALVDEVVAAFQPLARRQHKQLDWQPPDLDCRVQGDPALLVQVVDNLLDNAVRFTHEGGHIEVALDLDAQGEWLRLMKIHKDWGINHIRYHSWCPPAAAFEAAASIASGVSSETFCDCSPRSRPTREFVRSPALS